MHSQTSKSSLQSLTALLTRGEKQEMIRQQGRLRGATFILSVAEGRIEITEDNHQHVYDLVAAFLNFLLKHSVENKDMRNDFGHKSKKAIEAFGKTDFHTLTSSLHSLKATFHLTMLETNIQTCEENSLSLRDNNIKSAVKDHAAHAKIHLDEAQKLDPQNLKCAQLSTQLASLNTRLEAVRTKYLQAKTGSAITEAQAIATQPAQPAKLTRALSPIKQINRILKKDRPDTMTFVERLEVWNTACAIADRTGGLTQQYFERRNEQAGYMVRPL